MRKKIVAGNWKMNNNLEEAIQLATKVNEVNAQQDAQLILIPPFPYLKTVVEIVDDSILVGAQNCAQHDKGAYTGEVSASMIKSVGANYVVVGHSERRTYFLENNQDLANKVNQALVNKLVPIYCCGELLEQREKEDHFNVVKQQITEGLFHLSPQQIENCIIAYEPVWAIGTGITAEPFQAQEMHVFIRRLIADQYSAETANNISILYGGSCNPKNAQELFALPDVDGGLIGGASLVAEDFMAIAHSF